MARGKQGQRSRRGRIKGSKFTISYGPQVLQLAGPIILANWHLPTALIEQLQKAGQRIPQPVVGHLLLDTGASRTCISKEAADELGLVPTGTGRTYGAGGLSVNAIVFAQLVLSIEHTSSSGRTQRVITWEQEVTAVPEMEKHAAHLGLMDGGRPVRLIGLMGRDILSKAKVNYNGVEGKVTVNFDRSWLAKIETKTS